jgi:hypothetical protein
MVNYLNKSNVWLFMEYHILYLKIPRDEYKKFKVLCAELDLSIPKQTAALIKEFNNIQEENKERMKHLQEKK